LNDTVIFDERGIDDIIVSDLSDEIKDIINNSSATDVLWGIRNNLL
jgi:hypothetical protein